MIKISLLNAAGQLSRYEKDIKSVITKAIKNVQKVLPVNNVDIVVYNNPDAVISHLGVGGYTPEAHTLYVAVDTKHPQFKKVLSTHLARTITHELHHAARWATVGYGKTLFEACLTEGLADHFDAQVNRVKPERWSVALSKKEFDRIWKLSQKEFSNKNYSHHDWFFGSKERSIPRWAGYTIGYFLVQKYLMDHPKTTAAELHKASPSIFAYLIK